MKRKLLIGKARALAASLVLAGAAISGTSASAQWTEPPACEDLEAECAANYLARNYLTPEECYRHLLCYSCWGGYMCGADPGHWGATKPDTGKPW
ncbi:MAG: hypothetical protein WBR13_08805 [Allosphingosinicella sp.]